VSVSTTSYELSVAQQWTVARAGDGPQWYVIHTRSQHEKSVARQLEEQGITTFLPLVSEVHRWSDRKKVVQLPLFSCYAFVQMNLLPELWHTVMQTNGVLRFVGAREAAPIADSEIESIRQLLSSKLPYTLCPFLRIGQRVRIHGGALEGVEGILVARNGQRTLVISVEPIQRSIAVRIDSYQVEPV